jgi:hypothetical protein
MFVCFPESSLPAAFLGIALEPRRSALQLVAKVRSAWNQEAYGNVCTTHVANATHPHQLVPCSPTL